MAINKIMIMKNVNSRISEYHRSPCYFEWSCIDYAIIRVLYRLYKVNSSKVKQVKSSKHQTENNTYYENDKFLSITTWLHCYCIEPKTLVKTSGWLGMCGMSFKLTYMFLRINCSCE